MPEALDHARQPRVARRLFMVYDAKSGRLAAIKDSLLKTIGAGCSLCAITHGIFGKRPSTRALEDALGDATPIEYRHTDELDDLEARLGSTIPTPCILAEIEGGELIVAMTPDAIDHLRRRPSRGRDVSLRIALGRALAARGIASRLDGGADGMLPGPTAGSTR